MKIDIILNKQTPKANQIKNPKQWAKDNKELIQAIKDYLDCRPTAMGIASTQFSIDGERSMDNFFVHIGWESGDWEIIINPKVEGIGMTDLEIEACLTWPQKWIISERYRRINVEYFDVDGKLHKREIRGFESHVWQHEVNHLKGIKERVEEPNQEFEARAIPKLNRNDICPCNSGKKYKKCCLQYKIIDTDVPRSQRLLDKIDEAIKKERDKLKTEKKNMKKTGDTEDHSAVKVD